MRVLVMSRAQSLGLSKHVPALVEEEVDIEVLQPLFPPKAILGRKNCV